jgi:hypothetical protein
MVLTVETTQVTVDLVAVAHLAVGLEALAVAVASMVVQVHIGQLMVLALVHTTLELTNLVAKLKAQVMVKSPLLGCKGKGEYKCQLT